MAPLWTSSWSATWNSIYPQYGPLHNGGKPAAGALLEIPQVGRPSIGQILMSKRVRYAALVAVAVFTLAFRNFDRLHTLSNLRNGAGSMVSKPTPNSPVAKVPSYDVRGVDWSRFAYTQYVTNVDYLCNSVMIFETLYRLGSKADRVIMYPEDMLDPKATTATRSEGKLLIKARDEYKVKLVPVSVQRKTGHDDTWAESFTKLLAFNQTQYERVLNVDSDSTILQTMDELFLLPPCPVAMPRAYWLFPDQKVLSSQLILIQPSASEFSRILEKMESAAHDDYDMEIVNQLYLDQAMILPHRPYGLLTGEFRGQTHEKYLGNNREVWDPVAIFNEAKFLHFSDWPVPKPWMPMQDTLRQENQPHCVNRNGLEDCSARELWNGFYTDFVTRRSKVCNIARA